MRQFWKKKEGRFSITRRINLLFFVIVLLFSLLILRLAQMQLLNADFYQEKLTASTHYVIKTADVRGQIYDAKGRPLVSNQTKEVVQFTRDNRLTAQGLIQLAKELSTYVTYTETKVSDRAKKDYYLADPEVYRDLVASLPQDKRYDRFGNRLSEATVYANALEAVPAEAIAYSEDQLKEVFIFNQMNGVAAFDTTSLTTGTLSADQIARLTANQAKLPGISVKTDWERQSVDTALSSIIGRVSSREAGLPAEEAEDYLAKGYSLNDRVGTSYLEKAYESDLQGQRTVREVTIDKTGTIISDQQTAQGSKGNNLKLTVDLSFQEGVETILKNYFTAEKAKGYLDHSEGIYSVVVNPQTGAILALAGFSHDKETGELTSNALGTFTQVFTPGSVVKGATLAAGWENGVLSGNETLYDQEIGGIKSWFTNGLTPITAVQALEYSSNTYMVQIALRLMGQDYQTGQAMTTKGYQEAMEKLRATYAQYGLGVSTGLDIAGESTGYIPTDYDLAAVVNESFGQYDNYTAMQLAQYVATIANGGNRQALHLVEGIYGNASDGGLGDLVRAISPQTLNTVPLSTDQQSLLQQGFYQVVYGSGYATGKEIGYGAATSISAKTGTAESYVTDSSGQSVYTSNLNVVAYAPSQNPQVAVSVVLPHSTDLTGTTSHQIIRDIVNLYVTNYGLN